MFPIFGSRTAGKLDRQLRTVIRFSRRRCLTQSCRYFSHTTTNSRSDSFKMSTLNRTVQLQSIMKDYPSLILSKYEIVELEEFIHETVTKVVVDPVLKQSLSSLQWLQKRMNLSYSYPDNLSSQEDVSIEPKVVPIISIQMELLLPSLLYPNLEFLQQMIQESVKDQTQKWLVEKQKITDSTRNPHIYVVVKAVPPVKPIPVMSRFVEDSAELLQNLGPGLTSVAHFVAVYSCKGGVGKSTVAVNLAYALAARGGRVGLLDLDLYGPSLPILVRPDDCTIRRSPLGPGLVYPILHHGVKLLSLGFVNTQSGVPGSGPENGASIMKGPMAVKVVSQLVKGTDWGELDVLILDLPPGTGDVQLAVLQQLQLSGAVAVSTPSKLATSDTRKGIEMFTSLGVSTLAVVENMAYFEDGNGQRHFPFGKGLSSFDSVNNSKMSASNVSIVQLPISVALNDANDDGIPLTMSRPNDAAKELDAYELLTDIVSKELLRVQYGSGFTDGVSEFVTFSTHPEKIFDAANVTLSLDRARGNETLTVRIFSDSDALQWHILPSQLRSRDPKTGDTILDSPFLIEDEPSELSSHSDPVVTRTQASKKKRSPGAIPTKVERRGRYGFAVEWGDGATIIYSMRSIARAAGGIPKA